MKPAIDVEPNQERRKNDMPRANVERKPTNAKPSIFLHIKRMETGVISGKEGYDRDGKKQTVKKESPKKSQREPKDEATHIGAEVAGIEVVEKTAMPIDELVMPGGGVDVH